MEHGRARGAAGGRLQHGLQLTDTPGARDGREVLEGAKGPPPGMDNDGGVPDGTRWPLYRRELLGPRGKSRTLALDSPRYDPPQDMPGVPAGTLG